MTTAPHVEPDRTTAEQVRCFVAPGKLMLAGEYSVLAPGNEALAVAVAGCGVEARATLADAWQLARADVDASWREEQANVPDSLRFAQAAFAAARHSLADRWRTLRPQRIVTRAVDDPVADGKRGTGTSASAAAVVAAALHALAGRSIDDARTAICDDALAGHRAAQDQRGSGYDVATVIHGGLVHYRPAPPGAGRTGWTARRLRWPPGLQLISGYSGRSALTGAFVEKIDRLAVVNRARLVAELTALARPARRLITAFEAGDLAALAAAASACHEALAAWDAARGIGIVTPAIAQLVELARAAGVAAKVSGAGGGDSVVAFAPSPDIAEGVARAWSAAGFDVRPVERCFAGVRERARSTPGIG